MADEGLRRVTTQAAEQYCRENGNMIFFETSAKNSINVEQGFTELAREAMRRQQDGKLVSKKTDLRLKK